MFVDLFQRLKNWLNPPGPVILQFPALAVVEEVEAGPAYNRLRDWVTSNSIRVVSGETSPRTHWVQVASSKEACPVFPDDRCGYQPIDQNYAPCRRLKNHDGPCAHEFRLGIFDPDIDREEDVLGFFPGDQ